ncbi:MAG: heparan-alpha-glucosaminide N-acetyltransferase domain-containing protein [Gammaproteobacteria bacterium]|nr:heparan-alpha-glucosaminide N-acetyltransferase domain-containing protein [Gammaproteobacteria bacterium]
MAKSKRIAAIDWMRGFVMILMVLDHVSMAYDAQHISSDSAALYVSGTALPDFAFFTRWISHLCAPVFVFLAGTALAISVERKVAKGFDSSKIDKDILLRGAFIALLDPTIISLFSGRMTIQVLYAIGVAMMCMALFRRFSSSALLIMALAWIGLGELVTATVWPPQDNVESIIAALLVSTYSSPDMVIKYPLLPWLAMMILGWVFGRYILLYNDGKTRIGPVTLLSVLGLASLIAFAVIRYYNDYGNMFLYREDNSWQHWLHVSKYPPSAAFTFLELGIMSLIMASMMLLERIIGVRPNGVLLVFGQTSMMFYLVHRLILEGTATYGGLRHFADINMTYLVTLVMLVLLYPLCLWYRGYKAKHAQSIWLKYL